MMASCTTSKRFGPIVYLLLGSLRLRARDLMRKVGVEGLSVGIWGVNLGSRAAMRSTTWKNPCD